MDWLFFQELLAAKPEDMPRLWDRAISRFRYEVDSKITAVPSELSKTLIRESIIEGFSPYGTIAKEEYSSLAVVDATNKDGIKLC